MQSSNLYQKTKSPDLYFIHHTSLPDPDLTNTKDKILIVTIYITCFIVRNNISILTNHINIYIYNQHFKTKVQQIKPLHVLLDIEKNM